MTLWWSELSIQHDKKTDILKDANLLYFGRGSHSALDLYDKVHLQGNVLVFPSVTKEHRGTYYCVATNVVSRGRGRRGGRSRGRRRGRRRGNKGKKQGQQEGAAEAVSHCIVNKQMGCDPLFLNPIGKSKV